MITPIPYIGSGGQSQTALGHYGVGQVSGAIAATPTALDVHASLRWAPSSSTLLLVLLRLKLGYGVISAVSTAVRMAYQASLARQFTVDFTTAATAINMSSVSKTQAMRSGFMSNSQMGASGPRIATTAPQTGQTYTLDNAPFALTTWEALHASTATGTAVALPAGAAGPMQTLYEWAGQGGHPPVLSNNEGVAVQLTHTGWASGTVSLYAMWEWCEALLF